jgi:hypothetical protein
MWETIKMRNIKLKLAGLGGCAVLALAGAAPAQALINAPVPVANYITLGGIDWAWAAPCAPYGSSCGVVDMTYQSTQGWRFPTLAEFLARPKVSDFGGKCAAEYFSTIHSHCDFTDPEYPGGTTVNGAGQPMGYLFDYGYGITLNGSDSVAETWVVRGAGAIPEPATWAMMIGGLGLVGASLRRRAAKVSFA